MPESTAPPKAGEVVSYHRPRGMGVGVVLASGADGCRLLDATTGDQLVVRHAGLYRNITATGDDLRQAVIALRAMGLPVRLDDDQRRALEET